MSLLPKFGLLGPLCDVRIAFVKKKQHNYLLNKVLPNIKGNNRKEIQKTVKSAKLLKEGRLIIDQHPVATDKSICHKHLHPPTRPHNLERIAH